MRAIDQIQNRVVSRIQFDSISHDGCLRRKFLVISDRHLLRTTNPRLSREENTVNMLKISNMTDDIFTRVSLLSPCSFICPISYYM